MPTGPCVFIFVGIYLRLTITDTLGTRVGGHHSFSPHARVTRTFWYRVPGEWVAGGVLCPRRRDQLVDRLYEPGWRDGGPGGSAYVILDLQDKVLSAEEVLDRPWLGDRAGFFVCAEDGSLREVVPAEL
ncbi:MULTISPECIES: hypothetical protein [Polymorphospora]|uniref:Uncharacterized protein n=1 Tax=Polymorphospora lycopeni TaxID=3140240 RepID=A0ABV5D036_9ACTN